MTFLYKVRLFNRIKNKKMPETQETFEMLKKYVDEFAVGLLLYSPEKKLLSWNQQVLNLLETTNEDLKKGNTLTVKNQIDELLNVKEMLERDLVGLSKPIKLKKTVAADGNIILLAFETFQETVGEMSHELRRPITNIKTLTESLLLGAKNDPEISQRFLEQINGEVDRLTKLVNALLNISKIKSGKLSQAKKKINLKVMADEAVKLLQPLADKSKTKITNEVAEGYEIFADPEQIDHVIQNLIENAIKYSPEGSSIFIRPGPEVGSFQIDDTGIGIAPNEITKIFERFYRVDRTRAKGSSGLGLSIVKNVIDLHGGKIEVKSELGKGSSFIIHLPID